MKSNRAQRPESTGRLITIGLFSVILCLLFLIFGFPPPAQATPGRLDLSFGVGGTVTTPIGTSNDAAQALVIQPDGKLVAAGFSSDGTYNHFALARYNTDGSLDTTFGTAGKVTTAIGEAQALVIQPDGKLVAAGYSYNDSNNQYEFALARYNTDGSLDTTFGVAGNVTTAIGARAFAFALAIQSDGKLVAAGSSYTGYYASQDIFALARYNTDGSLDTTFGVAGKVITAIGSYYDAAQALVIQPDGKLVAAGYTYDVQNRFALVRYNTDGSLDTTFGTAGKVITAIGAINDQAYALAIQSDGKLVAAGYTYDVQNRFALVRYNTDGSLDTTFGTAGKVTTAIGAIDDIALALAIQSDGKLVAAGYSYNDSNNQYEFALNRYNTDGSLDTAFGTAGKVTTAIGAGVDVAFALAIQSDGKLVAAGHSYVVNDSNNQYEFALARYLGGTITIPAGASLPACVADYNGTCAYAPNPLTITSGNSVVWSNTDNVIHTATSDDHVDTFALDQPVSPANSFSTAIISGGASSPEIGPFITAVMQTKLYHCSLHPNMKGTLIILPPPPPTTTTTTTVITTTTTTRQGATTTTGTITSTTTTTIPGGAAAFDVDMGNMDPPCGSFNTSDIGFVDCNTTGTGGILVTAMTNISSGTVRWTMRSTPHTVTSEAGLTGGPNAACGTGDSFDSGVANAFTPGFVFTHTFGIGLGTCNYFCIIHPTTMQGQVNVLGFPTTTTIPSTTTTTNTTIPGQTTVATTTTTRPASTTTTVITTTTTTRQGATTTTGTITTTTGTITTTTGTITTTTGTIVPTTSTVAATTTTRAATTTTVATTTTTRAATTTTTRISTTTTTKPCKDNHGHKKHKKKGKGKGKCDDKDDQHDNDDGHHDHDDHDR